MVDTFTCVKAQVYHNAKKRTPAQIMAETGCTHIINGYLFDTKFQPLGWTVIDGQIISKDEYRDWGVSIDNLGAPRMLTGREDSFLSGVPVLKNGAKLYRGLTPDVARKAARTAVGWLSNGKLVLWCDKTAMTREELQNKLLALGVESALMLDGGGSTQGIFPGGKVTSSRKVPTLLLFWAEENEPKGEEPMDTEIKAYSLKKEGNVKLTKNFAVKEFACKDGTDTVFVADKLPMVLQYIRMRTGKAVTITSGYRTEKHNAEVGGKAYSQHLYGAAADIKVSGYTPATLAAIAREIMPDWGGVGIYDWGIHVDVRKEKADWKG